MKPGTVSVSTTRSMFEVHGFSQCWQDGWMAEGVAGLVRRSLAARAAGCSAEYVEALLGDWPRIYKELLARSGHAGDAVEGGEVCVWSC